MLDCANGAAYKVAPTILEELDADVITVNDKPDGFNINDGCGALHPKALGKLVTQYRADVGIALDGDADRLVVVDQNGEVIDGDKLIGALAVFLKEEEKLKGGCVATVMSNQALEDYLNVHNIELHRSNVGDKYVLEIMKQKDINFGGEQSGHVIFSDIAKTGDGLASALQVLALIIKSGKTASEALNPFDLYPQILKNLIVEEKIPLDEISGLEKLLQSFREKGLRDLIRYSGTENKIRLLLEGKDKKTVEECMNELQDFIKKQTMLKRSVTFISVFTVLFLLDQFIKWEFVKGFELRGDCISLVLAYNYGVAFSMFSFLEGNLKYIQIAIMLAGIIYLALNRDVFKPLLYPCFIVIGRGSEQYP